MKKILLVDADTKLLGKLGKRITKAGYEVNTASDGSGALESALLKKPDLIITNYHLPLFDGERLRAFLRNNPTTTHIPFIFLIDAERGHDEVLASIGGERNTFLVKPFRWQEMQERIESTFDPMNEKPVSQPVGTGVEGSLSEVSLVDLLQIFGLNRRTGTLFLQYGEQQGRIHLEDGSVVSVVLGETTGEKALYRILRWHEGSFRYHPGHTDVTRDIARSMDALLMEGMRQLDEWGSLVKLMPPPSTVLKLSKSRDELPQNMRPVTQEILLLMEFYDTLQDIVERSTHTDYDVCQSILGLIQKGIINTTTDEKSPVVKDEPLITGEEAITIHRILRPGQGDYADYHWGKILVFSSEVDLITLFISRISEDAEFKLSRDNFSNQEIINSSFGGMGTLEISENTYLQVFLLPSSIQYFPLWRAFSEGTVGAFFLHGGDIGDDIHSLEAVKSFIEGDLKRPVVIREIPISAQEPSQGTGMFKELFSRILSGQPESEVAHQ
jgi:CheY-like chemotaxis protein